METAFHEETHPTGLDVEPRSAVQAEVGTGAAGVADARPGHVVTAHLLEVVDTHSADQIRPEGALFRGLELVDQVGRAVQDLTAPVARDDVFILEALVHAVDLNPQGK